MRDYGIVSPKFWIGRTGKQLRGNAEVQLLALYLMTSPHATMTGVYHCPILYMANETGLTEKGASKALARLIEAGFCEYEGASETVFVLRMARYQVGESLNEKDKRVEGLRREVEKMENRFKTRFLEVYGEVFHLNGKVKINSPSEGASEPHRSQDQDQDQDQEQEQKKDTSAPPTDVVEVFDHWREVHGHPRASLDDKRIKLIRDALKIQPPDVLKQSISGYKNSPHHMGQNQRNTVYDDIEIFLRDAKHIDAGLKFFEKGAPQQWQ